MNVLSVKINNVKIILHLTKLILRKLKLYYYEYNRFGEIQVKINND